MVIPFTGRGALALGLAGCSNEKKVQELTSYCEFQEGHMVAATKAFEAETGIKVNAAHMSADEISGRIRSSPKASV